ncbi:MAG: lipoate--protein ligase [Ruminococcaceae bacterium]|jgi:lipoate-protein ligase A|nr:lipoate--protein ligase [Oscillospiraceae bacterium]
MPKALMIHATEHNPWFNLALETFLQESLEQGTYDAILYLWQNDHTVVIGRNQNAWAECNTGRLEEEGGRLARRSTGGGAVYHDLGNLNFSIVLPRKRFSIDDNFNLLLAVVSDHGISAERSGRNDILANGLKFSGNAFTLKKYSGLHHGTLLVDSDYGRIARYLTVSADKLKAKGVTSVRSRVTNLKAINPSVTVEGLEQSLYARFQEAFCADAGWQIDKLQDLAFRDQNRLQALHEHFASWNWRYGESVAFDATVAARFDWGSVELGFKINKGYALESRIYSDALDSDYIAGLPERLNGCRFHSADLAEAILAASDNTNSLMTPRSQMAEDIAALLRQQSW